jgi:hypothetical protein
MTNDMGYSIWHCLGKGSASGDHDHSAAAIGHYLCHAGTFLLEEHATIFRFDSVAIGGFSTKLLDKLAGIDQNAKVREAVISSFMKSRTFRKR